MRLLYVTNSINGSGGLERVLAVKASYLAENYDYQVSILVLNNGHQNPFYEFSRGISFYSINVGGNPLQYWTLYKNGIQKAVSEIAPDVICVCDDGLKAFFIPIFLKTRAKVIYERHVSKLIEAMDGQSFFKRRLTEGKWILMEALAKKFSTFVVLTNGNKEEWRSLRNLEVIPNPLSFYPDSSSELESKKVICVGKISYQKGQDLLVKAWEIIHDKHPDWSLELYGIANENFLQTDPLKAKNIFYFPAEKNIETKYLQSSIYVMSSRFEGFGMVIIEAMACGVPCVSFDCNYGPSDIIKNGEDGFIVGDRNIHELAEKINLLIENKDLRRALGQKARQNVKRFDRQVVVKQWDNLFKKLLRDE